MRVRLSAVNWISPRDASTVKMPIPEDTSQGKSIDTSSQCKQKFDPTAHLRTEMEFPLYSIGFFSFPDKGRIAVCAVQGPTTREEVQVIRELTTPSIVDFRGKLPSAVLIYTGPGLASQNSLYVPPPAVL